MSTEWEGYAKAGPPASTVVNQFMPSKSSKTTYLARLVHRVTSKEKMQKRVLVVERSCMLLATTDGVVKRVVRLPYLQSATLQEVMAETSMLGGKARTSQIFFEMNDASEPNLLINLVSDKRNVTPPDGLSHAEHVLRIVNEIRKRTTGTNLPVNDRRTLQAYPFNHFSRTIRKPSNYTSPRKKLDNWVEETGRLSQSPQYRPPANMVNNSGLAPLVPLPLPPMNEPVDILGKTNGGTAFGISLPDGPQKDKEVDMATELERAKREAASIKHNLEQKERENEERRIEHETLERERREHQLEMARLQEDRDREVGRRQYESMRIHEAKVTFEELTELRKEEHQNRKDLEDANSSLANIMKSNQAEHREMAAVVRDMQKRNIEKEKMLKQLEEGLTERERALQDKEAEAESISKFVGRERPSFSIAWDESESSDTMEYEDRGVSQPAQEGLQPTVLMWNKRMQKMANQKESMATPPQTPVSPIRLKPLSSSDVTVWNTATQPVLPRHAVPGPTFMTPATPAASVPSPAGTPVAVLSQYRRIPIPFPEDIPTTPTEVRSVGNGNGNGNGNVSGKKQNLKVGLDNLMVGKSSLAMPVTREVGTETKSAESAPQESDDLETLVPLREYADIRETSLDMRLDILAGNGNGHRRSGNPLDSPRATPGHMVYGTPLDMSDSEHDMTPVPRRSEQKRRGERTGSKPRYWKGFMSEWSKMAHSFGTEDIIHDPEAVKLFRERVESPKAITLDPARYNGLLT
eukprot:TRINITY_DN4645_c0_g1_i1.p1 TRINITY_DN4645_c0_g1~~TRINITY_DN4645_c0_g1_i1.p1  ORF type:complete len:751 (+),score=160.72 TRINITY_DN4645_c0_g1_i1:58-2310(+)